MLSKFQSVAPFYHGIHRQPQPIDISIGTRRTLLIVALWLLAGLVSTATQAATSDRKVLYAPIVPKAITSTLIDIERLGTRIVVVGERGHVLYSDDEGGSWQQAKMPFIRMLTGVSFVDDKQGWAVGHQSMIFHTSDGGTSWQRQLDGFVFQAEVNAANLARTQASYTTLAAELEAKPDESRAMELEDALFAFEDAEYYMEEPVVPTNLHDVWFLNASTGWAVGAFGRMIETRDGGHTWSDKSHLVKTPDGFHLNSITGTDSGEILIVGEGGVVFRSLDTGQSWEQVDTGHYGSFFGVVYDPVNKLVFTFGLGGALFQSNDLGETWHALNSTVKTPIAGGTVTEDGKTILAGPGGLILVIDGADSSPQAQAHPQANRMNHSTLVPLKAGNYLLVGTGGVKQVQIN